MLMKFVHCLPAFVMLWHTAKSLLRPISNTFCELSTVSDTSLPSLDLCCNQHKQSYSFNLHASTVPPQFSFPKRYVKSKNRHLLMACVPQRSWPWLVTILWEMNRQTEQSHVIRNLPLSTAVCSQSGNTANWQGSKTGINDLLSAEQKECNDPHSVHLFHSSYLELYSRLTLSIC